MYKLARFTAAALLALASLGAGSRRGSSLS